MEANAGRYTFVGLPGVPPDLRQQQVDTEWGILIVQSFLDYLNLEIGDLVRFLPPASYRDFTINSQGEGGTNLLSKDLGGVTVSTNDAQTTIVRHRSGQLWSACDVHSCNFSINNLLHRCPWCINGQSRDTSWMADLE